MASATTGRRLGRYHLADPLGGGPCGAVYRAKVYGVAGFERQFCVKRFHPELVALPVVAQRLSNAARAYGSLEHPRIARLHEYGVAAGEVFTATELVPGLDLMRLVAATHAVGQPLPPGAAVIVLAQVARAVGYAHGRGVNHLGLCPTNVIVTPDGDVKVADFGVLAQTLTLRPSNDGRLQHRINYLAPEQLLTENVSAATDVFALGAIAHELVTGERAFVGVSPLDVEHAILSGHVRDSGLPRPLGKVLARCFARSPFERFPDARALADAIDAALRVAPVSGGRRELAGLVKDAVSRLESMNEAQLSGAMTLAMPMPPQPMPQRRGEPPMSEGRQTDAVTTIRDPLAPPPGSAPARPVTARPSSSSPRSPVQNTLMGAAAAPIPPPPSRNHSPTRPPPIVPPVLTPRPVSRTMPPPAPMAAVPAEADADDSEEHTLQRDSSRALPAAMTPSSGPMPTAPPRLPNASPLPFQAATGGARAPLPGIEPLLPEPSPALGGPPGEAARLRLDTAWPNEGSIPDGAAPIDDGPLSDPMIEMFVDNDSEGVPVLPPLAAALPPAPPRAEVTAPSPHPSPPVRKSRASMVAVFLVLCAALGVGGVLAWDRWFRGDADAPAAGIADAEAPTQGSAVASAASADHDARAAAVGSVDASAATTDGAGERADAAAAAGAAVVDAGVAAAPPDAAVAVRPPLPGDPDAATAWTIESTPPGAVVYFDGAEQGLTPLKLGPSADRHTISIVMPGHALYTADVEGRGVHRATLEPVSPPSGPAGIKVKCKAKGRYYVFLDGRPTGQLCPTERIGVDLGEHTIEVYDLVTEERKAYPARVKETRNSLRIKVDEDDSTD